MAFPSETSDGVFLIIHFFIYGARIFGRATNMAKKVWYEGGLHFKCTGCGDCCTGAPGYVWVTNAEIEAMAESLEMNLEKFGKKYVRLVGIRKSLVEFGNGDCVFFDNKTRKCQVYEKRPRQCRTWPFWHSNLTSPDAWDGIAEHCPGCNRGPLIPLNEIEKRLNVMRV